MGLCKQKNKKKKQPPNQSNKTQTKNHTTNQKYFLRDGKNARQDHSFTWNWNQRFFSMQGFTNMYLDMDSQQ